MSFVNYEILSNQFSSVRMKENIRRLKEFNFFHCLLAGDIECINKISQKVIELPDDFKKWLEACDGGMLFETTMLTTKTYDNDLDLSFETYDNYYNEELRKGYNLSRDWFIFATAIHSDVYFFDISKKDGKVYQWDIEELKICTIWDTFEDWLTDQINEAIDLIANEELEPLDIKLEADDN